ncbi:hypothetical protein ACQJBY_072449 [Aegilops geniculata]
MGERVCAGNLVGVYKGERRSGVRLLPHRGQIKLRIAHFAMYSVALALQILDHK